MTKRRRLAKGVYTPAEVGELLKCAHTTIHRLIYKGKIKAFRTPGSKNWKISKEALIAFLESIGVDIPQEIVEEPEPSPPPRNAKADQEWRRIVRDPHAMAGREVSVRTRAVRMLDANLQALSVLTPLQRIGFVQAAADLVADFERIERERAS